MDGLCGSVSFVAALFFVVAAGLLGFFEMGLMAAVWAGALMGFLMWNLHPAKVFMGDTGSLFIGGMLCALAFGIGQPLLLIPVGIVYIVVTLSVILQVTYFKLTHGKRLFKMSPLHHHFEMCGWSENRIVVVFSLAALIGLRRRAYAYVCLTGRAYFAGGGHTKTIVPARRASGPGRRNLDGSPKRSTRERRRCVCAGFARRGKAMEKAPLFRYGQRI